MKSNKERYQQHMAGRNGGSNNGGGGGLGGAAWLIIAVAVFALLYSTHAMWCSAIHVCDDDLTIGEGKPIPDADEISKHFR